MPQASIKLALQDETEYRSVDLFLKEDGSIEVSAQDMGPTVKEFWGDADYEFGIELRPKDAPKIIFALIATHYRGDLDAVDKIRRLLEQEGIEPNFWSWA